MYSIITVIYGLPLTNKASAALEEMNIDPSNYFSTLYHGGADYAPGYIGVLLGEFNECSGALRVLSNGIQTNSGKLIAKFVTTADQKKEAENMIANLSNEIRNVLPSEIGIYFIFSTS